jgi:hypothetical protein
MGRAEGGKHIEQRMRREIRQRSGSCANTMRPVIAAEIIVTHDGQKKKTGAPTPTFLPSPSLVDLVRFRAQP